MGQLHGRMSPTFRCAIWSTSVLKVNAQGNSFGPGTFAMKNEWKVWRGVETPGWQAADPRVVVTQPMSSSTRNWSDDAGPLRQRRRPGERVASTDCGIGGVCTPKIAWAKLRTLAEGAAFGRQGVVEVTTYGCGSPHLLRDARVWALSR